MGKQFNIYFSKNRSRTWLWPQNKTKFANYKDSHQLSNIVGLNSFGAICILCDIIHGRVWKLEQGHLQMSWECRQVYEYQECPIYCHFQQRKSRYFIRNILRFKVALFCHIIHIFNKYIHWCNSSFKGMLKPYSCRTIWILYVVFSWIITLELFMTLPYMRQVLVPDWCGTIAYIVVNRFIVPWPNHWLCSNRTLIARFLGPPWGPSGANKTQVSPMLAPWTLLSGKWII